MVSEQSVRRTAISALPNYTMSAARQAGSKGPVPREVAELTELEQLTGHLGGMREDGRVRKTLSRREYPETTRMGDCFDSLGPAAGNGS
jgi:hypothetical protein